MFASELWIIYVLVFGAALLAVQGLYWLIVRVRGEKKAINRRLALSGRLGSASEVLEALRRERGLGGAGDRPFLRPLHELVVQTGLRIDLSRLILWTLVPTLVLFAAFSYLLGFGLLALLAAAATALALVYLVLLYLRGKRIGRFGEQFPDALDVIVRGLRAGHPFRVALALVAREMPDPIGSEFGILADEIGFGRDLDAALDSLYRRVGHEDLSFLAIAVNIQNQTGGNLGEILGRLAQLMRHRDKVRLKVRALSSEGRLSAVFLSLTPFILYLVISLIAPNYFAEIHHHPIFVPALAVGGLLLATGNLIMYRMVNFKF